MYVYGVQPGGLPLPVSGDLEQKVGVAFEDDEASESGYPLQSHKPLKMVELVEMLIGVEDAPTDPLSVFEFYLRETLSAFKSTLRKSEEDDYCEGVVDAIEWMLCKVPILRGGLEGELLLRALREFFPRSDDHDRETPDREKTNYELLQDPEQVRILREKILNEVQPDA